MTTSFLDNGIVHIEQHQRSSRQNCSLSSQLAARIAALYAAHSVSNFPGAAQSLTSGLSIFMKIRARGATKHGNRTAFPRQATFTRLSPLLCVILDAHVNTL